MSPQSFTCTRTEGTSTLNTLHCQYHHILCTIQPPMYYVMISGLSHRETLLGQLTSYLRSLRDNYTTLTSSQPHLPSHSHAHSDPAQIAAAEKLAPPTGKNLPQVVNNIVWTRQLEAKVSVECVCHCMCFVIPHACACPSHTVAGTFLHVVFPHISPFPSSLCLSPPLPSPPLPSSSIPLLPIFRCQILSVQLKLC